jgi:hypothetical protein
MVSSFAVSIALLILNRNGVHMSTHVALLVTIGFTTLCWLLTAYLGPQTDRNTLVAFYKKVRPFGPGWKRIRQEAGITGDEGRTPGENFPLALLGWVSGSVVVWSALFTVGNFLYGRTDYALALLGVFVVSGAALLYVINRLWASGTSAPAG